MNSTSDQGPRATILYLVADGPHSHDYQADFLYAGFCNLLGFDHVYDWPEKDCLHLARIEDRDDCQIDSDQCWPRKHFALNDVLGQCDLAILTAPVPRLAPICRSIPRSVPIVAVDGSDEVRDLRGVYEHIAGRKVAAYFKRELPLHAKWDALPLPLSYPASRAVAPTPERRGVFYWATDHNGGAPGQPRRYIADQLHRTPEAAGLLSLRLTPGQAKGTRPSPEEYHAAMAQARIGISWNGARNWDCNRFWENFAYGLAQVAERPRIQLTHAPMYGVDYLAAGTPDEAVTQIQWLLTHPEGAQRIARDGHEHFLRYHSSERRAEYILDVVSRL